jgi:hypothetical protein
MFDPIRIAIAMIPLATYLIIIGLIRLRPRVTVMSRPVDFLLTGMACVGIAVIGPIELFFPRAAYSVLGNWVWPVLLCLYVLIVMLVAFHYPPGVVVYGSAKESVRAAMAELIKDRDPLASWQAEVVRSEELGIQAMVEDSGIGDVTWIRSVGKTQNLVRWVELERSLHERFRQVPQNRNRSGWTCMISGAVAMLLAFGLLASDLGRLSQSMASFFQR